MSWLFFSLQASAPAFLRLYVHRASAPLYARLFALFQDFFVVSLLFWMPFPLAVGCGVTHHFLLLLDNFLYRKMQLRLRLSYWRYLLDFRSFFHSAKEMGLYSFLGSILGVAALHVSVCFWLREITLDPLFFCGLSVGALVSRLTMPKRFIYAVNHPFFLPSSLSRLEKGKAALPIEPVGSRLFDLPIKASENPHVIFLFLESFPAKYVSEAITPHFCQLKEEGIYFSQFYSNGTLTYRALLAGLFGKPPGSTAIGLSPYLDAPLEGLPRFFQERGYKSAFHHNGSLRFDQQLPFLKKHFQEISDQYDMENPFSSHSWGIPDEVLMSYTANWLEKQEQPTFLTLFTISNHHPWIVPEHYKAPIGPRFHQTLHYTDHCLHLFIQELKAKQLGDKSILFILGDHGQPQGEHQDNFYNSRFLYEENVHIPLLILAGGRIKQPQTISQVGSQMDLMATMQDLFGQTGSSGSLMRSHPEKVAFLQNPYSEGFVGCRKGAWKWIENRLTGQEELYDLRTDQEERNNLAFVYPEVARELKEQSHTFFADTDAFYHGLNKEVPSAYGLDLSNSLVTDEELLKRASPELSRVNLENCLLLTDQGMAPFLSRIPHIEELNLKGNREISIRAFSQRFPKLRKLDLSDACIDTEKLAHVCPHLLELSLNAHQQTSLPFRHLTRFKLFEAEEISDETFIRFLQQNPHLGRLAIYGGRQMTDQTLFACKYLPLEQLWVFDAPLITEKGIDCVRSLSIRSLIINDP